MEFQAALNELANLVSTPEFQQQQSYFFDRYCQEFDGSVEENKLSYTAIHNEYIAQVEQRIEATLGAEKYRIVCEGMSQHQHENFAPSEASSQALDILTSLADFEAFKAAMLAKKAVQGSGGIVHGAIKGIIDVAEVMQKTAVLRQAISEAEGWVQRVDEPNCQFYTKAMESGATSLRYTIEMELPPHLAFDMSINWSPESEQWRDKMQDITVVHDFGPNDKIINIRMAIPWAVRYITSLPETMAVRCVSRENWPEPGDYAYAIIPFDLEKNMAVEEIGMLKIKSGVISPHPTDPKKSLVTGCDLVNLNMLPSWGIGFLLKKMSLPQVASMTAKYKKVKGIQ